MSNDLSLHGVISVLAVAASMVMTVFVASSVAAEDTKPVPTVHDAAASDALPDRHNITIPTVDILGVANPEDLKRQVVVALWEEGKNWQHPHMLLMPDGKTIYAVWTLGHGGTCGPMKRSDDGGLTWSKPLDVPENWTSLRNCPSIHRVVDSQGKARLIVFARHRNGRFFRSISEDNGQTWSPMEPAGFSGVVPPMTVLPVEGGKKHLTWTHTNTVLQCESVDGGLTWSKQRRVIDTRRFPGAHDCEPEVTRSPDGKQLLMLMRENRRRYNSLYAVSNDEGRTWSKPREVSAALTGDRHTAVYAKDGRLVVMFRNRRPVPESESNGKKAGIPVWSGPTTAWVGTYKDIIEGREGQYRVTLLPYGGYGKLQRLPDGTIIGVSYCRHRPGDKASSIVLTRFKLAETDARLAE